MRRPNDFYTRYKKTKPLVSRTNNLTNTTPKIISTNPVTRPRQVKIFRPANSIFLSGGIGDVIAVESFLSDKEKDAISTVFYATNKEKYIRPLLSSLKSLPNLKNHITLWDDFSKFWCFYSLEECVSAIKEKNQKLEHNLSTCKDLSILKVFEQISKKEISYNFSSFLKDKLIDIQHLNLPSNYFVILPYSTDKRIKERDYNQNDWDQTIKTLIETNMFGIVLNSENEMVPKHELIVDLTQKTNLLEAVEILKKAKGYLGIDSWMSVLAAKIFDSPFIQIKSKNKHCYDNAIFYYAPKKVFDFLVSNIVCKI